MSASKLHLSKTPAPPSERISGSDTNPKGSAESVKRAKDIKFSSDSILTINKKVREHNEAHPEKKISISVAKGVVRRGMGAYSSTHRPTISGGKPNSRFAWGLARLNAFIYKIIHGKSESGNYNQDDDLIKELGMKVKPYADGGRIGKLAKGYTIADIAEMKGVSLGYATEQLRKGMEVEMEHTDDKSIAEAIAKDHLFEDIEYYKKLEKMENLLQRGATKYEVGGKVVSKGDNHPADAKQGGYFKGRPHTDGGIKAVNISSNQPIEVEGGEVIITKPAVEDNTKREFEGEMLTNREILSRINQSGGGVPIFSDGGDIASHTCGCSGKTYNYGGKMMTDNDILHDIASRYYRTEIEKRQEEYRNLDSVAYKKGGAVGYYLTKTEKSVLKKFKHGGVLKHTVDRKHQNDLKRLESDGYLYSIPTNDGMCLDVYVTEHGTNMLNDHDDSFFHTDSDADCGCEHKKYEGGGETDGVKFKKVKVTYSNGDETTTSVNPSVSEEDIKKYFEVGKKVNVGIGPEDNMQTITSVEILGSAPETKYKYFNGIDAKYKNQFDVNKAIEEMVDNIAPENMSPEERAFLLYYSGYGGLEKYGATGKGLLYEYFTPSAIAKKMWALAYKYGFSGGRVLEPSCGIGEFIKYAPNQQLVTGFEINPYSAKICKILYPMAEIVKKQFETNFIKNNNSIRGNVKGLDKYSLVIGNPPYGKFGGPYAGMGEQSYTKSNNYIDYFITRGLDLLQKDGLLIYIIGAEVAAGGTPFLQQKSNPVKKGIAEKAILLDAYRLPNGLFEQTDVLTDIIVLKKK